MDRRGDREQRGRSRKSFEMLDGGRDRFELVERALRCFRDKGNRLRRRIIIIVASGETEHRVA